jgi:hypothetical protein
MPKVVCKCGYIFNLTVTPSDDEHLLVPESVVESVIDSDKYTSNDVVNLYTDEGRSVLICPRCGRLYLQRKEDPATYTSYVPED